jgi:hypothetical protein
MHFFPASRTKRRLLKVASLGLAGLLAGLLAGCNDTPNTVVSATSTKTEISTGTGSNQLPASIEATQIPALRHPPSTRRLQLGAVHTVSQANFLPSRSHS